MVAAQRKLRQSLREVFDVREHESQPANDSKVNHQSHEQSGWCRPLTCCQSSNPTTVWKPGNCSVRKCLVTVTYILNLFSTWGLFFVFCDITVYLCSISRDIYWSMIKKTTNVLIIIGILCLLYLFLFFSTRVMTSSKGRPIQCHPSVHEPQWQPHTVGNQSGCCSKHQATWD